MMMKMTTTTMMMMMMAIFVAVVMMDDVHALEPSPEPEYSAFPYGIKAAPLIDAAGRPIAIRLDNTLNFGTTRDDVLWLVNEGMIKTWAIDTDDLSVLTEERTHPAPIECPSTRVVHQQYGTETAFYEGSLIFLSEFDQCAPKNGLKLTFSLSEGTTSEVFTIGVDPRTPIVAESISGAVGLATPELACEGVDNAEDIDGNFCVVQRGACTWQAKYDSCMSAGAIGVVIVNYDDDLPSIGIGTSYSDAPLTIVGATGGAAIRDLAGSPHGVATLEVGTDIPKQGIDYGQTIGAFDFTNFSDVNISEKLPALPFDYIYNAALGEGQGPGGVGVLYAYENSVSPPILATVNTTDVMEGQFDVLGETTEVGFDKEFVEITIAGSPYLVTVGTAEFKIFDASDPSSLTLVSQLAPDLLAITNCSTYSISPQRASVKEPGYLYLSAFQRQPVSDACPGLDGDTLPILIFDIQNPEAPKIAGTFSVPEAKELTGAGPFSFGVGAPFSGGRLDYADIALITAQASGAFFYDFSDPIKPVPASAPVLFNVTLPPDLGYLAGATNIQYFPAAQYYREGIWYVSTTPDGVSGELWVLQLKDL